MASITKNGKKFISRVYINGKQEKFYGFTQKREAERFGEKVELLVAAVEAGDMTPDLLEWKKKLAEADSKHYGKLAKLGLVEPLEEPHTLDDLIERYHAGRQNMEKITVETYAKPEKNLRDFFGAMCELSKITSSRADD